MALDSQVASVAFTEGLDTRTQAKLVVPGKWLQLFNYSQSVNGALERRCGVAPVGSGITGNGLALHGSELLGINSGAVSTVSSAAAGPAAKQAPGELPYVEVGTKREVVFDNGFYDSADTAYGDGFQCTVFRQYNSGGTVLGLNVTLVDQTSGAKLLNNQTLILSATAVCPRVVFFDNAFFIFYISGTNLYCRVVATSAPSTLGTQTSLVLSVNLSSKSFDACAFSGSSSVAVVYLLTAGVISVQAISVTRTGTTPAATGPFNLCTAANVTEASIQALTCRAFGGTITNRCGVFFVHTAGGAVAAGLVGVVFDAAFGVTAGPPNIDATVPPVASPCHVTCTPIGDNMQVFTDQISSFSPTLTADIRPLRVGVVSSALASVLAFGNMLRSACYRINAAEASGPQGPFIAGKAFTSGTKTFLPVCMLENYGATNANVVTKSAQCSAYIVDTTDWSTSSSTGTSAVVAGMLYQTLGLVDPLLSGSPPPVTALCSTPTIGTSFGIALQERGKLDIMSGFNVTPVGLSTFTMTPRTTVPAIWDELGESTFFAGGQLGAYDGRQVVGFVFPNYPEGISCVVAAPGGGAKLTVGVHQVVAVYEWIDGAGNRHQSAPSLPVSVTVANASDRIDVLIPTTQLSQAAGYNGSIDTLRVVLYMTAAAGLTFYRTVSDFANATVNNPAASTVAMSIGNPVTMLDAALTTNEQLYYQPSFAGSTLPNVAPPPSTSLAVIQNRLFCDEVDQPGWFRCSQPLLPNTGIQFAEASTFRFNLPAIAGHPAGFAQLDEKVIIFARERIFVMYGQGPKVDGTYSSYSQPQDTHADVGCIEPRSICAEHPDGIMFQAASGIYLLTRSLETHFIGAAVQAYTNPTLGAAPTSITAAAALADRSEIRFVVRFTATATFSTLVYSHLSESWSVHQGYTDITAANNYWMVDALWWPAATTINGGAGAGAFVHISTNQGLHYDDESDVHDTYGAQQQTPFTALAKTSWLKLSKLEGFQRVRWLYLTTSANVSPSSTLNIAVDYDDGGSSLAYNFNVPLTPFAALPTAAIDLRTKLRHQKCKSVQFTFTDTPGAASQNPLQGLQALALELGIKKGLRRLPAAQSVG
jgi:hypothetical protein